MKISKTGVSEIFQKCGVSKEDSIFLHGDAFVTAELEGKDSNEKMAVLFDGILDLIGSGGTLIVPTFTYSATKGEVFDVTETKSEVGLLSEYFRKRPDVTRSLNPVFSVASVGAMANAFTNASIDDCFGEDTCFGLIYQMNTWIFTLGCSFDRVTFIHYVDQLSQVDYRYFKSFPATIINGSEIKKNIIRFFVRDMNRKTSVKLDNLKERLQQEGLLKNEGIGRALLTGVRSRDFFKTAVKMIEEKPNAHIQEGY